MPEPVHDLGSAYNSVMSKMQRMQSETLIQTEPAL